MGFLIFLITKIFDGKNRPEIFPITLVLEIFFWKFDKMSRLKFFIFLVSKVSGNTFLNNAPAVLAKGSIDSNLQFMVNGGIAERPSLATVMLKNTYT